jgi:hypothetical protein
LKDPEPVVVFKEHHNLKLELFSARHVNALRFAFIDAFIDS